MTQTSPEKDLARPLTPEQRKELVGRVSHMRADLLRLQHELALPAVSAEAERLIAFRARGFHGSATHTWRFISEAINA